MLSYTCPNCKKKYEVTVMGNRFSYLCQPSSNKNKVLTLVHEDDDCFACQEEITKAQAQTRERIHQETVAK